MRDYQNFEGPTAKQLTEAYQQYNARRIAEADARSGRTLQSGVLRWMGTPRKAKYKGRYAGVSVK